MIAAIAANSLAPSRADEPEATGFVFEPTFSGLQAPAPETHSVWPDRILAMQSDGARLHSLWTDVDGVRRVAYRSSTNGTAWSAPETASVPTDATSLVALQDGTVFVLGNSMHSVRRDPRTGTWTASPIPVEQPVYLAQLAAGPDGRLWVVYTRDAPWASSRTLMCVSRDPSTGTWSAPETVGTPFGAHSPDLLVTVTSDGVPWVTSTLPGTDVSIFHRTPSGWVSERPIHARSAGQVNANALGARADGSLLMPYWDRDALGTHALKWATRDATGWTLRGSLLDRTSVLAGRGSIARAPNGDDVVVWEETSTYYEAGYRVASRLSPGGTWTPAAVVGAFPRAMRAGMSLAVAANGRAVLGTDSTWGSAYDDGGILAVEQPDGTWSDEMPAGPARLVDGPPGQKGIELAAAPNDSAFAAWWQETHDGLGTPDTGRTPHIVFAVRGPTGSWSVPQRLDQGAAWRPRTRADLDPGVAGVASSPEGTLYVIWRDIVARPDMSTRMRMVGRLRTPEGVWSDLEELPITWPVPRGKEYRPQMAFDAGGSLWVMDPYGKEARRRPDGTWTEEPALLSGSTLILDGLRMAVAPDGTQFAQYAAGTIPGGGAVLISRRTPGGSWSPPERVDSDDPGARVSGDLVIIDRLLVSAWSEQVSSENNTWRGKLATRPLGGTTWDGPKIFATEGGAQITDVAAMRDGSWWVLYQRCARKDDGNTDCAGYPSSAALRAVRRAPDGRWDSPVYVSPTGFIGGPGGVDDSEPPHLVGDYRPLVAWGLPDHFFPRLGPSHTMLSIGHPDASLRLASSTLTPRAGECVDSEVRVSAVDGRPLDLIEVAWITSPNIGGGGAVTYAGASLARFCRTRAGAVAVSVLLSQGALRASQTLTWNAGDPTVIHLSAAESPEVGAEQRITVQVTDGFGNPVPAPLTWTKVSGPGEMRSVPHQTAEDGTADGVAYSEQVGDMTVEVAIPDTNVRATVSLAWRPGPPRSLRFDDPPASAPTGSLVSLRVSAVDTFGNDSPQLGLVVVWSSAGQGAITGLPATDFRGRTSAVGTSATAGETIVTALLHSTGTSVSTHLTWV